MHLKDKLLAIKELKNQLIFLADSVTYPTSIYVSDSTSATVNYTRSNNQRKSLADSTQVDVSIAIGVGVSLLLAVLSVAVIVIWLQRKRRLLKLPSNIGKLKVLLEFVHRCLSIKYDVISYNVFYMIINNKINTQKNLRKQ